MNGEALRIAFHRSIAGKLTAAGVCLTLAIILMLYAATRYAVSREVLDNLQAGIDTDIAGLADLHASGGRAELVRRIGDRIALQSQDVPAYYLLLGQDGLPVIGNLLRWPPLDASRSQAGTFELADGRHLLGRATLLDGGMQVLVARDLAGHAAIMHRLALWFALAGLVATALALLVALVFSRRLQRRLQGIQRLHLGIERGDRVAAVAARSRDEIDVLAEQTQATMERQAELVRAYRDISDHVAHEIRTPLTHLDHRLLKLLEHSVDPRVQEAVGRSRADLRSVVRMLESLLDISASRARIGDESGLEPVDLSALVRDLVDLYRDSAEELGFRLDSRIADGVGMRADAMQLRRLLSNLLDNALKYCPTGSRIHVELDPGPRLVVEDDGPGIPPEQRERLFEKFARGSQGSGHGLGLALARAIAQRHGLDLRLAPSGGGARFILQPEASR